MSIRNDRRIDFSAEMNFVLRCLVALQLAIAPVAHANGVYNLGVSFQDGIHNPVSSFQTFYVANGGSDSNDGKTPATAWQTISHVVAQTFAAHSVVLFNGGQTFTGSLQITTTNALGTINFGSYGTGQATISSGNSAECSKATNVPAFTFVNLICTGGGNATNSTAGISIINSQAGNTKLAGPTISGVTVSGYGYNCISIEGANGTSGFSGIILDNFTTHDCTGNSTDSFGTSCWMIFSKTGYGLGATAPAHSGGSVTRGTAYNCTGTAAATVNWTGSGGLVSQAENIVVGGSPALGNVAHDFGGLNGGPFECGGIWSADARNITISYNEMYNGLTGPGGTHCDGGGFDGGQINSLFAYNKIHDNAGLGMTAENYFDGTCCTAWGNNRYQWNQLQNNLKDQVSTGSEILFLFSRAATGPAYVTNNKVVQSRGGAAIGDVGSSTQAYTLNLANNDFGVNNGGKFTNFAHPSTFTFAGDNYWSYGTAATFVWNGSTYSNASVATAYAAWQSATGQEKVSGGNVGHTVDPLIYVPGGLFTTNGYLPSQDMANNLQAGSPMIGAGLNVNTLFGIDPGSTDYYGTSVTPSTLPVGAAAGDFTTFAASCTASTNFLARVSSFTKADNINYNSLLCGMNSDGDLALSDALYMLAAPNSAAALLNLKSTSFSLVVHNAPTFTARHGYTGNGSNAYLDTVYTPSTAGGNMVLAGGTIAAYDLSTPGSNAKCIIGATNNTTTEISIFTNASGIGTTWFTDVNDFTGLTGAGSGLSGQGFFLGQRVSGADNAWYNGAHPGAFTTSPIALTPNSIFILAENVAGSPATATTDQISAALIGGVVSPVNVSLRINSFMQAYGINTY